MNPIDLTQQVEESYRRYLQTTFYFRDPTLRVSFEEALKSGHLSKGPFLEATPVFQRGQSPRTLFQSLLGFQLDPGFLAAIHADRPLYKHQEQAIRQVFQGRNVVVATGTGSGKTESFLYPILLHLYQEFLSRELAPGVCALILYPMNALANDQRERLGAICQQLVDAHSPFRFTFGQYVGTTPEDQNDSYRHARDYMANRLPGELVLRSEMRRDPPHILLTNYSMLEYLLLRPDDSPLFDNGRARWWTFLVLDEAHQYRGSRGIEMAMLLRRLKRRLTEGGQKEPLRCIATSATLVSGDGGETTIAQFATDLFGEEFGPENIILGDTEPIPEPASTKLALNDYRLLSHVLRKKGRETSRRLAELASRMGLQLPGHESLLDSVGRILQRDSRSTYLRRLITGNPVEVRRIAAQVFNDLPPAEQVSALSDLVELLVNAQDPASQAPLLSARYHLFLRSLESAFITYWPNKKVFLDRKMGTEEHTAFEVALCRECGQHYLVGPKGFRGGKLLEPNRDPSHPDFGATFLLPIEDQEGEDETEENGASAQEVLLLCLQCGQSGRDKVKCGHPHTIRVARADSSDHEDKADQIARCLVCGYSASGRDPVREVVHGTDGPNAVIATTLYQSLPENRKRVLAFADGRQEAAFFAWYLEDSYKNILSRNLILKTLQKLNPYAQQGLSLRELATALCALFRERKVFPRTMGDLELRREAWLALYREFLTDELRISLEGVGLAHWSIQWPDGFPIPSLLLNPPWSLTEQEARDLIAVLLDTMRVDKAVELRTENSVSLNWSDLGLAATQVRIRIGSTGRQTSVRHRDVQSWDGKTGRRAQFLAKLLKRQGFPEREALEEATSLLRVVWEAVRQYDVQATSTDDRLFVSVEDARRLNPDWWRFRFVAPQDIVFQCDTCGRVQSISIRAACPRHRCCGTLQAVRREDLEPNHYRFLYKEELPGVLRVEEHTAQLEKEKASEFQKEFRNGNIHVLSCSTTFELGVDLGDLDAVFLRNVPPEAFNYAQRVGRSGRRSGYPGLAITYCRRAPHDLYHFSEPYRLLKGQIRPPVLSLSNEKIITRHIAAVALSAFFRTYPERFETVESLLGGMSHPSIMAEFSAFLRVHRTELEETLYAIVPPRMVIQTGLANGDWITRIAGNESRFALTVAEVTSDSQTVNNLKAQAASKDDFKTAAWATARARTIAEEDVLSFLSRKVVIPKYGFPVDVVELDTQRAQRSGEAFEVSLQRDLAIAISEFAPTSKLIANKREWTSYGLKRVLEKEWPRKLYKRCIRHNVFCQWEYGQPEPPTPCEDRLPVCEYIIPRFGFVTNRDKPRNPTSRPTKVFTTRPYFAGSLGPDPGTITMPLNSHTPLILLRKATPGVMAGLCEGRRGEGFYVCGACGAGFRKPERSHKTPFGQECRGTLKQVSLGHEFVTDVVQLQFLPKVARESDPMWSAFSLAYALVEGVAEVLEVPSTDLSATVAYCNEPQTIPPIILYDNVPGGAGLVARLEGEEIVQACLEAAHRRVSGNCGCDESTSCYGCLRSYRNQFAHQHLQRGPVKHYLEAIFSQWK